MSNDLILPYSINRPLSKSSLPRDRSKLWLDKNENFDDIYSSIHKKIISELDLNVISAYPEMSFLYEKLAKWVGVDSENLLLAHGSDGVINATFRSFVREGDLVAFTSPTFAMYPIYSNIYRARHYEFKYKKNLEKIDLDVDAIVSFVKKEKPRLVFLPIPDSPTGTVIKEEEFECILNACQDSKSYLMIDEAYHPFYDWSAVPWVNQSSVLIVARTFSKAWGAAGVRVGYAISNPEVIKVMNMVRPMYEIGSLASEFIFHLLDFQKEMYLSVNRINESKQFFSREMIKLGFQVLESHANFIHVNFGDKEYDIREAIDQDILYRQSFNNPIFNGYSRFTIAPLPVMSEVLERIKNGK